MILLFVIEILRLLLGNHDTSVAADATAVDGSQDPQNHDADGSVANDVVPDGNTVVSYGNAVGSVTNDIVSDGNAVGSDGNDDDDNDDDDDDDDDDNDNVSELELSIGTIFHSSDETFHPFDEFKERDWYESPAERNRRKKKYFLKTLQQELDACKFTLEILCRGKPDRKILLEVSKSVPFETQLRRWEELVKTEQRNTLLIRDEEQKIREQREALYEKLKRK